MADYYKGQIFIETYPEDAAAWCNTSGKYRIDQIESVNGKVRYQIVEYNSSVIEDLDMLKMTPLDFVNALETIGVTYDQIKALCDKNADVDKQLHLCNHVYRGNPLLDSLCGQFGVTTKQLDDLFVAYGGY